VLQQTISRIQPATWERINQGLLLDAKHEQVARGKKVRIDSTVTETGIHAPSDSDLLWDSVRVMVRLLETARSMPGTPGIEFRNYRRRAKKRAGAIVYTRGKDNKAALYRDLIKVTQYGCAPKQVAVDGGYASKDNLDKARACGVEDVAFHKKRGLRVEEMVKITWVYRQLRNFRAGIEAGISCLKQAYGLSRCTW